MHVDTVAARDDAIASSCACYNAPAASYWLRRVLGDGGQGKHRVSGAGRRGRSLQYTVASFVSETGEGFAGDHI